MNKPIDTYRAPLHGWTCFHCGEEFSIVKQKSLHAATEAAREHFGSHPDAEPLCKLSMWEQRELAERVRAAEESEIEALAARDHASEEAAMAIGRLADLPRLFPGALSPHDIWVQFDALEGRAEAAEAIVHEASKVAPGLIERARDIVCTVPDPEPHQSQKKRQRLVAEVLCHCDMTDGFCTPRNKEDCRCWRLAAEALRMLGNYGCFR